LTAVALAALTSSPAFSAAVLAVLADETAKAASVAKVV
jgi:hypothetical protein